MTSRAVDPYIDGVSTTPLDDLLAALNPAHVPTDRAQARRQQVLTAAAECFRRRGFHGASMAEINPMITTPMIAINTDRK